MATKAKSDNLLISLVDKVILDEQRKELYTRAIPRMTAEEKVQMLVGLLEYGAIQLEHEFEDKLDEKLEELYDTMDDSFTTETFETLSNELLAQFLENIVEGQVESMAKSDTDISRAKAQEVAQRLRDLADELHTHSS